ncbi:MAG: hypothetical protein HZA53_08080 [Planctomycetes bacterium]|nr:hypothetical protein [Planctomycetota bacterium]
MSRSTRRDAIEDVVTLLADIAPKLQQSVDFDTDVTTWIAHGKVAVESGDLVTNERGELLVRGLPVGS